VDLPDNLIIEVTHADICSGKRKDSTFCPIALALKAYFPETKVVVGYSKATILRFKPNSFGFAAKVYKLPDDAIKFIQDFDYARSVEPSTFILSSIPAESILSH
jgi:hypothetical protein